MDAVEFLKEYNRMCSRKSCGSCSLYREGGQCVPMESMNPLELAECVKKVEQWSKENPVKTRQSEFLEHYPEARIDESGVLQVCPSPIFASYRGREGVCLNPSRKCADCRRELWLQEVE